ncbi:hypothetical protein P43SY_004167 [Pythium insidiosum]|uniref:ABC transmembrane type-1 domain-containing protein n=1 Tax=Pythium insidiosum TaxID=114742 RepID=A0AAD5LBN1_PYTIN|nr:hypothetical protein P43SY_004167 [Pythium insidiosum]
MARQEATPLLKRRDAPTPRAPEQEGEGGPELGTARFPFHPEAPSTPWWRRLCFELFQDSGNASAIEERDLWALPRDLQSAVTMEELRARLQASDGRLLRASWRMNRPALLGSAALQLAAVLLDVLYPILLFRLLTTVVTERSFELRAVVSQLAAIFTSQLLSSFLARHAYYQASKAGIRVAGGLRALIIEQCLRHGGWRQPRSSASSTPSALPTRRRPRQRVAEIATIYNEDVGSIVWVLLTANRTWCSVVALIADVVVLVHVVEIPWLVLLLNALLFCGIWSLQLCVGGRVASAWRIKLERRLTTIHECFSGIQMIKFSASEDKMMDRIASDRRDEVQQGLFTALIVFRQMGSKARLTIMLLDMMTMAKKSALKIQQLLDGVTNNKLVQHAHKGSSILAAELQHVWLSSSGLPHATDVLVTNANLSVRRGELVVIHGLSGVGKSLLISAIRGDIDPLQGYIHVDASLRAVVLAYFFGPVGVIILSLSYVAVGRIMALRTSLRLYQIGNAAEDENLNFISETLDGESVIRAFGQTQVSRVVAAHHQTIDVVQRQTAVAGANYNRVLLRATVVNGLSLLALVALLGRYKMQPAQLGLVLYYIFVLQDQVMTIRMGMLTTMALLHSAERIRNVVFDRVSFGYEDPSNRVPLPQVSRVLPLHDVSFSVGSGERLGVVGRTGSGKSSLAMALFRMHPLVSGRILSAIASELLPEPVRPTTPTRSPLATENETVQVGIVALWLC